MNGPHEPVHYEPWTDGHAVGFRCTRVADGAVEYIYLNPSQTGGDPHVTPDVFLYQGPNGDPAQDPAHAYYEVHEDPGPCEVAGCSADGRYHYCAEMADPDVVPRVAEDGDLRCETYRCPFVGSWVGNLFVCPDHAAPGSQTQDTRT
jgi:hypothetical protein